jgi:hypothetical protein
MKVYVVFWNCSEFEGDVMEKVFSNERKAREYVNYQNKVSDLCWTYEEVKVEE